jgi:hypothetical protein
MLAQTRNRALCLELNPFSRPELRQEHPLNLSISISGGKENNNDLPSNGERSGDSPT